MRNWEKVLYSLINGDGVFKNVIRQTLRDLGVSIKQFSKIAHVPKSTLYKSLSSQKKGMRLSNLREIILGIRQIEEGKNVKGNVIALVADRGSLENVRRDVTLNGQAYAIEPYPAANIEEAMIQGINAERDGVKAIICGPITAYTLEKVVRLPVIALRVKADQIQAAIDIAVKKI